MKDIPETVPRKPYDHGAKMLKGATGHYPVGWLKDGSRVISCQEVIDRNQVLPLTKGMFDRINRHNPFGIREGECFVNFPTTKKECSYLGWSIESIEFSKSMIPIRSEDFKFVYEDA